MASNFSEAVPISTNGVVIGLDFFLALAEVLLIQIVLPGFLLVRVILYVIERIGARPPAYVGRRQCSHADEHSPLLPRHRYRGRYCYEPLTAEHSTRVLIIYPARSFTAPLRGDIATINLLWCAAYDALSYTWADEQGDASLSELLVCTGARVVPLTKNCAMAIRRLRHPTKARRVWIDAVCINQADPDERTHQVAHMERIYATARRVVAYTGEGTPSADALFDWLNSLDKSMLDVPSLWESAGPGAFAGPRVFWRTVSWAKGWTAAARRHATALLTPRRTTGHPPPPPPPLPPPTFSHEALDEMVQTFLGRRWFRRVWVLQEVALPSLGRTSIVCGSRTISATRALHLLSLIHRASPASPPGNGATNIFLLFRRRIPERAASHLLDLLIATRDREATDPRDRIYGILSLARSMDAGGGPFAASSSTSLVWPSRSSRLSRPSPFPPLADYCLAPAGVFARYSAFFIQHHGPAFFLSLINPSHGRHAHRRLSRLPSWAADWSRPDWLDTSLVENASDFPAGRAAVASQDEHGGARGVAFRGKDGHATASGGRCEVLMLSRRQVISGFFTRRGHLDGGDGVDGGILVEAVGLSATRGNEVLVQLEPGVAALLRQEDSDNGNRGEAERPGGGRERCHVFVQICPYAQTEDGVRRLVECWSELVVGGRLPKGVLDTMDEVGDGGGENERVEGDKCLGPERTWHIQ